MSIEQVVMSGDGFYQSMAYHAFRQLDALSFWAQCVYCWLAIGSGYGVRHWACKQPVLSQRADKPVFAAVDVMGPAIWACIWMGFAMLAGLALEGPAQDLLVIWKVLSLTLWVLLVRCCGWVLRCVMRPHNLLRFFLLLIEWFIVLAMVLTFFGLFQPLSAAIEGVQFAIGSQVFKGSNMVSGITMGVLALTLAGQLSHGVAWGLQRYARQDKIMANDALMLTRVFSVFIFISMTLGVLVSSGIEASTLAAFAGALGIGLGFGMQEVVINFVSGLYILFEQAMKVGDYVTINQITGRVVQLSSRAIVIRDAVGTESLIPNSSVTKGVLQNHTLSNEDFLVSFYLSIAEVADFPLVQEQIRLALDAHPRVLKDEPRHVLIAWAQQGEVRLEISCWINDLRNGQKGLISDLLYDICTRLKNQNLRLAASVMPPWSPPPPTSISGNAAV
ncbi:MAG: mechanosensitive ion channel family protein [Limnohabitans sp.]